MQDKKLHIINYILQLKDEKLLDELEKLLSYAIKEQAIFIPNLPENTPKLNGNHYPISNNNEIPPIQLNGKENNLPLNSVEYINDKLREKDKMMYLENIPED